MIKKTRKIVKKSNILDKLPSEYLKYIVNYLNNNTTIQVLVLSRSIHNKLITCATDKNSIYINLFTSISVHPTDDLILFFRRYINHRLSMTKTILYRLTDEELKNVKNIWPFTTKTMIHVDRFHKKHKLK